MKHTLATSPLTPGQGTVLLVRIHVALRAQLTSAQLLHEEQSTVLSPPNFPHTNRSLGRASNSSTGPLHSLVPRSHCILSVLQIVQTEFSGKVDRQASVQLSLPRKNSSGFSHSMTHLKRRKKFSCSCETALQDQSISHPHFALG